MRPKQVPELTIVQSVNGTTTALLFDGEELPVPILASASIEVGSEQLTHVSITVPCRGVTVMSEADMRHAVVAAARQERQG